MSGFLCIRVGHLWDVSEKKVEGYVFHRFEGPLPEKLRLATKQIRPDGRGCLLHAFPQVPGNLPKQFRVVLLEIRTDQD